MTKVEMENTLVNKMSEEYDNFKKDCIKQTSEDIVKGFIPYELVYKSDLLSCFEDESLSSALTDEDIDFLVNLDMPLDWLFTQWLESDGSHMDMLRDVILESLKKAREE